jgi:ankyrin repeat protein
LEQGADVNMVNQNGKTALDKARRKNRNEVVDWLEQYNAQ